MSHTRDPEATEMVFNVLWLDEEGSVLSAYSGPDLDLWLPATAPSDSICARFIDPYGDTVFNRAQVEVLLKELRSMMSTPLDAEKQAALSALITFVGREQDLHTYLKFMGD